MSWIEVREGKKNVFSFYSLYCLFTGGLFSGIDRGYSLMYSLKLNVENKGKLYFIKRRWETQTV